MGTKYKFKINYFLVISLPLMFISTLQVVKLS